MKLSEYRALARKDLKSDWNWAAGLILIAVVISLVAAWLTPELGDVLLDLLLIGISFTLLDLADNNYKEDNYFTAVFSIFTRAPDFTSIHYLVVIICFHCFMVLIADCSWIH